MNIGKPHNASESFCSEVAQVTSGYISLVKESRMTNSDINKGKSIILPQNGAVNIFKNIAIYHRPTKQNHLVNVMVFPVVMYGCESQTIKKAEHTRIDAFEVWCWRRLLRVP